MSPEPESKAARQAARRRLATLGFFARGGLMCLSFLLSLMLYLYVQSQATRVITRDFSPGFFFDVPSNVSCVVDGSVTVHVMGPQAEIDRIEAEPQLLVAVLNRARVNQAVESLKTNPKTPIQVQIIPVTVKAPNGMDDLTIDIAGQGRVQATFELKKRVYREVEIRSASDSHREATFDQRTKVAVSPSGVWLDGPASQVSLATPVVRVDFDGLSRPIDLQVTVVDRNDEPMGVVTAESTRVTVAKVRDQGTAFLNVVFKGHPALGYTVTGYEIQPTSSIQLTGRPELLAQAKSVDVNIDVTDLRTSKAFTVVPELKRGLQLSPDQLMPIVVTVTIERRHR